MSESKRCMEVGKCYWCGGPTTDNRLWFDSECLCGCCDEHCKQHHDDLVHFDGVKVADLVRQDLQAPHDAADDMTP